jgi:hypothetical protein
MERVFSLRVRPLFMGVSSLLLSQRPGLTRARARIANPASVVRGSGA